MSGPADRLLELMYEWMDEAEKCSSNLRGLAQELESLREKYNVVETISSTTAVAGTVLSILAAPFTGGASLLVGAVAGGLGAGVSVVTKLIEAFESSDKLERVKAIDRKCNNIAADIQSRYYTLRAKCPSTSRDEIDKYVVKEFLKAMLRRLRLSVGSDMNDPNRFVEDIMYALYKTFTKGPDSLLGLEVIGVLSLFSLKLGGSMLPAIAAAGGVQIGKAVIGTGASAAFLGVVGLGINLSESIINWKELIENKHETNASKSVRETAKKIDKAKTDLSNKLSGVENRLREAVKQHQSKPTLHQKTLPEITRMCGGAAKRHQPSNPTQQKTTNTSETTSSKPSTSAQGKSGGTAAGPGPPDPPGEDGSYSGSESSNESGSSSESMNESSSEEEEKLKMVLINARSVNKFIKPNRTELIDLIQNESPDVLLITETWLTQETSSDKVQSILPEGFSCINEPRFDGRRGGGVMIVYPSELICEQIRFDQSISTFEYVAATVRRPGSESSVLVLNIYRPPNKSRDTFMEEVRKLLTEVYSKHTNVVIGGDFNIWVDCKENRISCAFEEMLNEKGLVQHVSEITRQPRPQKKSRKRAGKGRILDLVMSRPNVRVSALSVQPNSFSDHKTVLFTVKYRNRIKQLRSVLHRKKRKLSNKTNKVKRKKK